MLPPGRVYRYPLRLSLPDAMPNIAGGMLSVPYDMGGMPMHDMSLSQSIPIRALASALANATSKHNALEMGQTKVLHLLESPEAPKAKVAKAMKVLRTVAQQQQAGGAAD
ncbi:hypothetical protein PTKIN_Ptkin07bG0066700 [Pterospermum kingtungense]